MKVGTTLMTNSSIAPASRNDPMIPPPPISQMFWPRSPRSRSTNASTGSETKRTPGGADAGGFRENT